MTVWSAFLDEVMPEVPKCGTDMATLAVKNAARELCRRGRLWRDDLPTITLSASTGTYALSLGTGTAVAEIIEAWLDDETKLEPVLPGDLDRLFPKWRTETGTPRSYLLEDLNTIRFVWTPDAEGEIDIKLALMPSLLGTGVLDSIGERYSEEIGYGAKYRLMRMKKKPWTDPENAGMYFNLFEAAIGEALTRADKGGTRAPLHTVGYHSLPGGDE